MNGKFRMMASLTITRILFICSILQAPRLSGSHTLMETVSTELKQFYEFMVKFGKTYTNPAEQAKRFDIFNSNLKIIQQLNNNINDLAEYGLTKFSDLTPEEFENQMFPGKINPSMKGMEWLAPAIPSFLTRLQPRSLTSISNNSSRRDFLSWVENNPYYPGVEDQGLTGLCVIFAVVGTLSIMYSEDQKRRISLSKQQVADCASFFEDNQPFTRERVYRYVLKNYLTVEADYPFQKDLVPRSCKKAAASRGVVALAKYGWPESEAEIKKALHYGPLVTSAVGNNLQHYVSGVITDCPNKPGNHALVIVEYGIETIKNGTGVPYYLLRNSWGTDYGNLNGHIKVQRGTCSVAWGAGSLIPKIRRPGEEVGCFSALCKKLKKKN